LGIGRGGERSRGDEAIRRRNFGCRRVFTGGEKEGRVEELVSGRSLEELDKCRNDPLPSFW